MLLLLLSFSLRIVVAVRGDRVHVRHQGAVRPLHPFPCNGRHHRQDGGRGHGAARIVSTQDQSNR